MKKQFITFEIALQLKELGFNERCFGCWKNNTEYGIPFIVGYDLATPEYYNLKKDCIAAPLWQQTLNFLRKKYKIFIEPEMWLGNKNKPMFTAGGYYIKDNEREYLDEREIGDSYEDYNESIHQSILKAIKLIKEQNEKY